MAYEKKYHHPNVRLSDSYGTMVLYKLIGLESFLYRVNQVAKPDDGNLLLLE
ncbi:MAG: hypothetical protein ACFFC7_34960 [Candidatus Hermodarchaeota archaeon]